MLLDKWIPEKFLVRPQMYAVEMVFSDEGIQLYYIGLKNKKGKLEIFETGARSNNLTLPAAFTKNKWPLALVLSGNGVIVKKIITDPQVKPVLDDLISEHLPALNSQDFAIQLYTQDNGIFYLALCRNELLLTELEKLKEARAEIAAVFIGPPVLTALKPVWDNFAGIQAGNDYAELQNNCIETIYEKKPEGDASLKLEGLVIEATHVKAFAAGLNYMLRQTHVLSANTQLLDLQQKHAEKNKLRTMAITAVAAAFILTLVNVVFYSYYFDINNELEKELFVYQGKYEELNALLANYEKKKTLFENSGILGKKALSEYADKIAKTVPDEVVLSELYFNPGEEEDENPDSLLVFKDKTLVIKGNCNKSLVINNWVNSLKALAFVKEVRLDKFLYGTEGLLPNYEITLFTK